MVNWWFGAPWFGIRNGISNIQSTGPLPSSTLPPWVDKRNTGPAQKFRLRKAWPLLWSLNYALRFSVKIGDIYNWVDYCFLGTKQLRGKTEEPIWQHTKDGKMLSFFLFWCWCVFFSSFILFFVLGIPILACFIFWPPPKKSNRTTSFIVEGTIPIGSIYAIFTYPFLMMFIGNW